MKIARIYAGVKEEIKLLSTFSVYGQPHISKKYCTMLSECFRQVFIGPLIDTDVNGKLTAKECAAVCTENGKITEVLELSQNDIETTSAKLFKDWSPHSTVRLDGGKFMIPGFIDCHTHAAQFPNLGVGYDKSLLDWLESHTFPLERKYADAKFAEQAYSSVVKQTLKNGTTTACYFATLHGETSTILAERAAQRRQRAFIGKVNMNIPRDDGYWESTEESVENTTAFIESVEKIGSPLVKAIITPRFALSCNMELMQELAKIAKAKDLHIQSHVSENKAEIEAVKEYFPEQPSYTAVYDAAGLLTNKTVLAHGVHLEDSELALLKERGTAVIHCPSSNMCLKSGFCDVQRLRANDITVGLGTDVSAGSSYSMLDAMRSALQVSKCLSMMRDNYTALTCEDVFHMATLGGAKALNIDDEVGNLVPGKTFDVLIIDLNASGTFVNNSEEQRNGTLEEKLQRFIYSGDVRNIVSVLVAGRNTEL